MQKILGWRPDTCGCRIRFQYDTDSKTVAADQRKPEAVLELVPCEHHAGLPMRDAYVAVWEENDRKNRACTLASESTGTPLADIEWSIDKDRVVVIKSPPGAGPDLGIALAARLGARVEG